MFNIHQDLVNISQNLQKDTFDAVKVGFKDIVHQVSGVQLGDGEFILDQQKIKLRTSGPKRIKLTMFLEEIHQHLAKNNNLKEFIVVL